MHNNCPADNTYNSWETAEYIPQPQNPQYLESEENKEETETQLYTETYEAHDIKERPALILPPPNPQFEVFSPVIPIPPGTPVIYADVPEMVVPAGTFQVYTPPVDMQYVSRGPFFYSPTIPTTWYPVGINSQGFIFPTTVNQNLQSN